MSTITLPNIRVSSDLTVRVRLKDGGVAIDWSTLTKIKASIYSDAQRALAGRCDVSIDAEDSTLLVCSYAANKPQYVGVNRIVVSAKYMGETKTYDKPAFNFVRWTADQEGEQITIDDPDVDVEIDVEDISSSILQEAVEAAFEAADRANDAAAAAEHMVDIHTGPEGKSAYEVAVEEGYVGTEEEWLASLVGPQGPQGIQGETGEAAGFGTASASLTEDGGNPGVTVSASGSDTAKNFAFTFKNLKGDKGDKGDQGNTGSSVEYPYELVNNLTTDDATKGLAASQGVALAGQVSQLEAEVGDLSKLMTEDKSSLVAAINESGFSGAAKTALMELLRKIAFIDEDGQDYLNTLYAYLFPDTLSIDAVFTQGQAVIYEEADLATLKQYLVVTALYKDGTSLVLPDNAYTLIGTLEEGTSTITVTYGDKSDTFDVLVSAIPREVLFGEFLNGYAVQKLINSGIQKVARNSTAARATTKDPFENKGYIFTVTDSTKYNIVVYDITSNEKQTSGLPSGIVDDYYYIGGDKSIAWKTEDSVSTPYAWLVLKKLDGTAFTAAELADGAAAVFNYTKSS